MTRSVGGTATSDRYAGRVVAITGAAGGLGTAMALRFAAEGGSLSLADTSSASLKALAEALDGNALVAAADVRSSAESNAWVTRTVEKFGAIDVLVNCAGVLRDNRIENISDADWDLVVDVSLRGSFNCTRAAVPHMKRAGYGRIISLASMSRHGNYGQANYAAAKAGLVGMARSVALEVARYGITSNVIAPGPIDTPLLASIPRTAREKMIARIPVGRAGRPDEIAAAAAFIGSAEASFITGVVVDVDGGITLAIAR